MEERILFKYQEDKIYISVIGSANSNNCLELKDEINRLFDKASYIKNAYIDLKECNYMDSTFMGILVGINSKLKEQEEVEYNNDQNNLYIVTPSKEAWSLLEDMSISYLSIRIDKKMDFPDLEDKSGNKRNIEDTDVLESHENLINISSKNKKRFGLLYDLLKNKDKDSKD